MRFSILLLSFGLILSTLPATSSASGSSAVLLVDDDHGWDYERPFLEELQSLGRQVSIWDTARQGEPGPEVVEAPGLVVWVTGGRWSDLSARDVELIDARIRRRGNTLLAGRETGRALRWGFRDRWNFGFEYDDTTFHQVGVRRGNGFGRGFHVATDHGRLAGGEALYSVAERLPGQAPGQEAVAAVRHWSWGARVAWIGFDLRDIFSSWDRREVLRDVLWYVSFDAGALLAELASERLSPESRAARLELLREELVREETGDALARELAAAESLPAGVALLLEETEKLRRVMRPQER